MARRPGINLLRPSEDDVTKSQLFPILTMAPELVGKGFLVPAITTVLFGIGATAGYDFFGGGWGLYDARVLGSALAIYFSLLAFYIVYAMCGKKTPWWCFVGVCLITTGLMFSVVQPILQVADGLATALGLVALQSLGFVASLPYWILRVGLFEEALKVIPVALLAYLAFYLDASSNPTRARIGGPSAQARLRSALMPFAVREPLDGILFAVASASAFLLIETLFQYADEAFWKSDIPVLLRACKVFSGTLCPADVAAKSLRQLTEADKQALVQFYSAEPHVHDLLRHYFIAQAKLNSLGTILFRTLMAPFAHTAWSGIVGYGIGLAVLRPKSALKIIVVCLATAAVLHGVDDASSSLIDSLGESDWVIAQIIIELASYAILAAMILKARQLSPTRASNFATTFLRQAEFELRVGSQRIPLRLGARLTAADIAQHGPGIAPDAPVAEVTHSPQSPRILGLKNLSQMTWRATLPDKRSVEIPPGNSMRLVGQCRIQFGSVEGVVA